MMKKKPVSKDLATLEENTRAALSSLAIIDPDVQDEIIRQTIPQTPEPSHAAEPVVPEPRLTEPAASGDPAVPEPPPAVPDPLPAVPEPSPAVPEPPPAVPEPSPAAPDPGPTRFQQASFGTLTDIPVEQIEISPYQPRVFFEQGALDSLRESIDNVGLHTPILVRPLGPQHYQLVAGERRFRAVMDAGHRTVPAIVRTQSDQQAMLTAFSENLQRENYSPYEEAKGYARLCQELALSRPQLGKKLGVSSRRVEHLISILGLPDDVLEKLFSPGSDMTIGHAETLLPLNKDLPRLEKVVDKLLSKKMTVKQLRTEVSGERRVNSSFQPVRLHFLGKDLDKGCTLLIQHRPDRPADRDVIDQALEGFQAYVKGTISLDELRQLVPGHEPARSGTMPPPELDSAGS